MNWIHGGRWDADEDDDGTVVARLRGPTAGELTSPFYDARAFFKDLRRWQSTIGRRYGLEVYTPSRLEVTNVFEFLKKLTLAFPDSPFEESGIPTSAVVDPLLNFLERFGPLGPVRGVIQIGHMEAPYTGAFSLHEFFLDARRLGEQYREAVQRRKGQTIMPKWASLESGGFGHEYRLLWHYAAETVTLEAQPLTLHRRLQTELLSLVNRPMDSFCRFCHHAFMVPVQRGQPSRYCFRHKTPRFRKMALRGRAQRYLDAHPDECLADVDHS